MNKLVFSLFYSWAQEPFNWLFGIKWTVEFEDGIPVDQKTPYVILCNHQSTLDVMGMMQV